MRKSFEKFLARQEALARQYGEAYEEKQHNRGKLTARERIEFLLMKAPSRKSMLILHRPPPLSVKQYVPMETELLPDLEI